MSEELDINFLKRQRGINRVVQLVGRGASILFFAGAAVAGGTAAYELSQSHDSNAIQDAEFVLIGGALGYLGHRVSNEAEGQTQKFQQLIESGQQR